MPSGTLFLLQPLFITAEQHTEPESVGCEIHHFQGHAALLQTYSNSITSAVAVDVAVLREEKKTRQHSWCCLAHC